MEDVELECVIIYPNTSVYFPVSWRAPLFLAQTRVRVLNVAQTSISGFRQAVWDRLLVKTTSRPDMPLYVRVSWRTPLFLRETWVREFNSSSNIVDWTWANLQERAPFDDKSGVNINFCHDLEIITNNVEPSDNKSDFHTQNWQSLKSFS